MCTMCTFLACWCMFVQGLLLLSAPTASPACKVCGGDGHNARTCPQRGTAVQPIQQQQQPHRQRHVCSICGELGHNALTHAQHAAAAAAAERTARGEYLCGYCQQPGHNIRTCPTHIADKGAARARERRQGEQQEEGGGEKVEEEQDEERDDGEQRDEHAPMCYAPEGCAD